MTFARHRTMQNFRTIQHHTRITWPARNPERHSRAAARHLRPWMRRLHDLFKTIPKARNSPKMLLDTKKTYIEPWSSHEVVFILYQHVQTFRK